MVRLGVKLLLTKLGLVGPFADLIGNFMRGVLGLLVETGIYQIDLAVDSLREGMKLKDFDRDATEAYNRATAKVYDETEKQKIRAEYLRIIARMGAVGDRPI